MYPALFDNDRRVAFFIQPRAILSCLTPLALMDRIRSLWLRRLYRETFPPSSSCLSR
jgi:hypothetical protein